MDVGAGCGVIGLEWFKARNFADKMTLIEKQEVFLTSQKENTKSHKENFNLLNEDFLEYEFKEKFDIIMSNPPYFIKERSRPSSSTVRNTCRQIEEDHLKKWFFKIYELLKDDGSLFFVFRADEYKWLAKLVPKFTVVDSFISSNYSFHQWKK